VAHFFLPLLAVAVDADGDATIGQPCELCRQIAIRHRVHCNIDLLLRLGQLLVVERLQVFERRVVGLLA
jgi:hypothetical protein